MAKILIVEDDSTIVMGLTFCLEQEGFLVSSVSKGKDALNFKEKVDLVLLDLNLPDIHGFEVLNVNGHSVEELIDAFEKAKNIKNKPTVIIAKTIKGKGVSFMEDKAEWHGKAPSEEEYNQAIEELEEKKL